MRLLLELAKLELASVSMHDENHKIVIPPGRVARTTVLKFCDASEAGYEAVDEVYFLYGSSLMDSSTSSRASVLVEKPTEEDSTIIAVGDTSAAHHVNVNDVCMAHIRAEDLEEPQTSTFFENVYDKSSYDLGNFTNKILSDNEKRQILDMGPLQPSGPFPTDINQNNRCFSKSYYVSSSKNGPVNRFWLLFQNTRRCLLSALLVICFTKE
ncbi:hypothetical protein EVAR_79232_1 [Eumeta japonica]|uniref:Uncharacterized protein n=1 Tax=Eumeta variegata TaxID=151549 RepID=A0A4C1Z8U3_EUMVA|nr:hypothetical protein EVAR_79232_1 [Eumeta japonica]